MPPQSNPYFVGLDLGQSKDFTALTVVERIGTDRKTCQFHCRHLQRWPLGTSYPDIVRDVCALLKHEAFGKQYSTLAIDQTGVGAPVVDLFKEAKPRAYLKPVHITAGHEARIEKGVHYVPKAQLVSVTQSILQTERLKIAEELPELANLKRELLNFQIKVTAAANDVYGAWREGTHDDLVLALAMPLWLASQPNNQLVSFS